MSIDSIHYPESLTADIKSRALELSANGKNGIIDLQQLIEFYRSHLSVFSDGEDAVFNILQMMVDEGTLERISLVAGKYQYRITNRGRGYLHERRYDKEFLQTIETNYKRVIEAETQKLERKLLENRIVLTSRQRLIFWIVAGMSIFSFAMNVYSFIK